MRRLIISFRILASHDLVADGELAVFTDKNAGPILGWQDYPDDGLFPPMAAEMSKPSIIRGVRVVKVSVYPVQYNKTERKYIIHDRIETEISFTDAEPINPVLQPTRRHRSQQFLRVIDGLTLNGDDIARDDPDFGEAASILGHYLIVTIDNILEYSAPFIEWRRKSGYKVDILSLSRGQAGQPSLVKREIQARYDEYLDDGIDPFDFVHLIGDRSAYENSIILITYINNLVLIIKSYALDN